MIHADFLKRWVRPYSGMVNIRGIRTVSVEAWLRQLRRKDCEPALAIATKAKIRNVMSVMFNHAIRYEWLEQGRNPIRLVRQSTSRMRTPEVLEPSTRQPNPDRVISPVIERAVKVVKVITDNYSQP